MESVGFALTIALQALATITGHPAPVAPPAEAGLPPQVAEIELLGAASATEQPGVLAAWSRERALLSIDDGRTFHAIVDAPDGQTIRHAALSSQGRLYVVLDGERGHTVPIGTAAQLVAVDLDGERRNLALPPGEVDALVAGQRDDLAVVLYRPAEAIPEMVSASVDGGQSWASQAADLGNAGFELAWSAEGVLETRTSWGLEAEVPTVHDGAAQDVELVSADARGRALGLRRGHLVRFGGATWQRVL